MLSVVMPFHNEAPTLRTALKRLLAARLPMPVEAILVDDGSTDSSFDSVADLTSDPRVSVIRLDSRSGKGRAVREGLAVAQGELAGVLDADLEYDPKDLGPLVSAIDDGGATVAYGTRQLGPGSASSFLFVLGNRVTSLWASILFNSWLTDIHTCLKVAPLEVWRSLNLRGDGFDLDSEATAKFLRAGHHIYEVPISYSARGRSEGKKLRWTEGVTAVRVLLRERFAARPS